MDAAAQSAPQMHGEESSRPVEGARETPPSQHGGDFAGRAEGEGQQGRVLPQEQERHGFGSTASGMPMHASPVGREIERRARQQA